jgi:hypothetical protein
MATNQVKSGVPQNRRFFKCPSSVTAGMPVLIGTLAGVALNDYDSTLGGTTFDLDGTFSLTVVGGDSTSAGNSKQINPGDEIFAIGTYDSTTNCQTALVLDATTGNIPFGSLDQNTAVSAGASVTASVRLKVSNSGPGGK